MKKLEVFLPYPKDKIAQRFGENANSSYASVGLAGHTAYDWSVPYGTPIPNCVDGAYCYSVMHKDDPDLSDYRAVFFIMETEDGQVYEISYGHCSKIFAVPGRTYALGEIIAEVGNTGPCYVGNRMVTEAEKKAGSKAGAHLHGPQIRVLLKTKSNLKYDQYITTENGMYRDAQGFYYAVPNYGNGYNGCVSLAKYSTEKVATLAPIASPQPVQEAPEDLLAPVTDTSPTAMAILILKLKIAIQKLLLGMK